jgi:hypothetical protein
METGLIIAVVCGCLLAAGIWIERRRAANSHKRWLRSLGKVPLTDVAYREAVQKHEGFLNRVRKP